MNALEAHAMAASKARSFRQHMALAARHLAMAAELEQSIAELLPECSPEAALSIQETLEGFPISLIHDPIAGVPSDHETLSHA